MSKITEAFEAWWADTGEQSLFALNTTTDDDIKILAGIAWEAAIREASADHVAASGKVIAEPVKRQTTYYGYCPICGREGVSRERGINGNDTCVIGHKYASSEAIPAEPVKQEPVMDYEHICALRESEQIQAGDSYFFVRPENDTPTSRKMFFQGFERGFHKGLKYASHVRTKDLTDAEVEAIMVEQGDLRTTAFARAVIAADRKINK